MKPVVSRITIEILGGPKEHVEQTLHATIEKLKQDKNLTILKTETFPCTQLENKLWSTFADIEFETPTLKKVLEVCYDYMPSTIEVLEPMNLEINCYDVADVFNDFLTKLHKHTTVLNKLQAENIWMMRELEKHQKPSTEPKKS